MNLKDRIKSDSNNLNNNNTQIQQLQMQIQTLSSDNSKLMKLCQELQKENDNLRNKQGLMLKEQQNDLQNENTTLSTLVDESNVMAVERANRERDEAIREKKKIIEKTENKIKEINSKKLCTFILYYGIILIVERYFNISKW